MLGAPSIQASNTLTGSQTSIANVTITPSSEDEQPLKIAGSTLSRSARIV